LHRLSRFEITVADKPNGVNQMRKKVLNKRNPFAKELQNPIYRNRIIDSKTVYNRKKENVIKKIREEFYEAC
jgi:hypothetical protein